MICTMHRTAYYSAASERSDASVYVCACILIGTLRVVVHRRAIIYAPNKTLSSEPFALKYIPHMREQYYPSLRGERTISKTNQLSAIQRQCANARGVCKWAVGHFSCQPRHANRYSHTRVIMGVRQWGGGRVMSSKSVTHHVCMNVVSMGTSCDAHTSCSRPKSFAEQKAFLKKVEGARSAPRVLDDGRGRPERSEGYGPVSPAPQIPPHQNVQKESVNKVPLALKARGPSYLSAKELYG